MDLRTIQILPALHPHNGGLPPLGNADPFYDRGSTFPLFCFGKTGFLEPKSSEHQSRFRQKKLCRLGPWDCPPRRLSIFAEVSFRARYGAPSVRSLIKVEANLYRRTLPHQAHTDENACLQQTHYADSIAPRALKARVVGGAHEPHAKQRHTVRNRKRRDERGTRKITPKQGAYRSISRE